MDGSHQDYQHGMSMATDLSLSNINDQGDIGIYPQPLDLQSSNQANSSVQHGYSSVSNYSMGHTSQNRSYMPPGMLEQYHSNSHLSPYKSVYSSPSKAGYQSVGNDLYGLDSINSTMNETPYIHDSAQDFTTSQKDLTHNVLPYKNSSGYNQTDPATLLQYKSMNQIESDNTPLQYKNNSDIYSHTEQSNSTISSYKNNNVIQKEPPFSSLSTYKTSSVMSQKDSDFNQSYTNNPSVNQKEADFNPSPPYKNNTIIGQKETEFNTLTTYKNGIPIGQKESDFNLMSAYKSSTVPDDSTHKSTSLKSSTGMKIVAPKGYTGKGSEYAAGTTSFKSSLNETTNSNSSSVSENLNQHGMKSTPYKPRYNLSEKDMRIEEESSVCGEDKNATQDYTETNLPRELMSKMFGLLKEGMFCDAVLVAGSKEIRVHKLVLMAASPFLMNKMLNPSPGESIRVELPQDIPIEVASQLVHYLYDGNVTITTENVGKFARTAKLFNLEHLVKICEQFVEHYNLETSLLNVANEDISIVVSPITPQRISKGPESTPKTSEKEVRNIPKKSATKKIEKEDKGLWSSSVGHVYGTRTASGTVKKKIFTDDRDEDEKGTKSEAAAKKGTNKKPLALSKNSEVSVENKKDFPQKQISTPNMAQASYLSHPRKRRLSLMAQEAQINQQKIQQESNADEDDIELPLLEEDVDDDYQPPKKMTTQSGMQRAVFEGSRRGKPQKSVKKPMPTMLGNFKKGFGKKKSLPLIQSTKSEITRPPPKKRAREFAEKEVEEMASYIFKTDKTSFTNIKQSQTSKPNKKKKRKAHRKLNNSKLTPYSGIGRHAAELEEMANSVPEDERSFICKLCGNEFVFPKRCITHVMKTHEVNVADSVKHIEVGKKEKTPKSCDICGYVTKDMNHYYMHYHKYFRHGVPLPKGWKPYKCEECGKECFTKFQLKDHKLIHKEKTPFVCETCGTGFKSRTCLNSHVYHKHSTVRKHHCPECPKTFKTRTQLLVHSRTHSGEKPFQCPECFYKSTTRGNMRIHLTNKHKFKPDKIQFLMDNIKYDPTLVCIVEVNKDYDESDTKKNKIPTTEANTNDIMVLNEKGQINVLENVRVVPEEISAQQGEGHLDQTVVSSIIEASGISDSSATNLQDAQQYLLQTINIPIPAAEVAGDTDPSHLLLNSEQLSQNETAYTTPVSLVQDENIQTITASNQDIAQGQKHFSSEEIQTMIVQAPKQFGQVKTNSGHETFYQMVPTHEVQHFQVQDSDSLANQNQSSHMLISQQGIPVQIQGIPNKKNVQYQFQIADQNQSGTAEQGSTYTEHNQSVQNTKVVNATPVTFVPFTVQKSFVPVSKPEPRSVQQVVPTSTGAITITYMLKPQKLDSESHKVPTMFKKTRRPDSDDLPTQTLWNTPITVQGPDSVDSAPINSVCSQDKHQTNTTVSPVQYAMENNNVVYYTSPNFQ